MTSRMSPPTVTLAPAHPIRPLLAAILESLRGPAWLVGGPVRDLLLGRPMQDVDIAVPAGSAVAAQGRPSVSAPPTSRSARLTACRAWSCLAPRLSTWTWPTCAGRASRPTWPRRDVTVDALAVDLAALLHGPAGHP